MAVIAARIYGSEIRFAADRQITSGSRRALGGELTVAKVAQVNGLTIGSSGKMSHAVWLFGFARNHAPLEATEIDVSQFMLEFHEFMKKKDSGFNSQNSYLLAFRGRLFEIYDGLSVFAVPEFAAIGSGGHYAVAAMHLGHEPKVAAKVAAELDLYCSGDIDQWVHAEGGVK